MLEYMHKKNSSKEEKQVKGKRSKTKVVGSVRKVYKIKGFKCLFHMWKKSDGKWYACGAFHPKVRGGAYTLLPRGQCPCAMLQLQYKSRRKSIYIWPKARRGGGKRTLQSKKSLGKMVRFGL